MTASKPTAPSPPPAPRRAATPAELTAAALFLVAALVLAGTLVQQRLARRPLPQVGTTLTGAMIVPTAAQEGVTVTPGSAHLLSVESTPSGARVLLDGAPRGETPFSTDFPCEPGRRAMLELERPGYRRAHFELDCVEGSTRVSATLKRSR